MASTIAGEERVGRVECTGEEGRDVSLRPASEDSKRMSSVGWIRADGGEKGYVLGR
jgi:hypothetical protein